MAKKTTEQMLADAKAAGIKFTMTGPSTVTLPNAADEPEVEP